MDKEREHLLNTVRVMAEAVVAQWETSALQFAVQDLQTALEDLNEYDSPGIDPPCCECGGNHSCQECSVFEGTPESEKRN
jgi:hypothetical protein